MRRQRETRSNGNSKHATGAKCAKGRNGDGVQRSAGKTGAVMRSRGGLWVLLAERFGWFSDWMLAGLLDVVDHHDIYGCLLRVELEADLLLDGFDEGWGCVGRGAGVGWGAEDGELGFVGVPLECALIAPLQCPCGLRRGGRGLSASSSRKRACDVAKDEVAEIAEVEGRGDRWGRLRSSRV